MSIFKCKMCGGALEINNNETVATCEYCGTQQTLPKLDDDKRVNMYDRANHFRRNNEFDKAMGIYEQILNEDNTDAEAYWSLVLCRYGIEYVEDPSTHKRIPTVNRAQFTSIFDDDNYKSALQYADAYQKSIYEDEAKAINEIQKGILAISQKEEPFDVFICYKETDNNGRRTPDSVLANDLYHQLTKEGYKVFFSRITLEDKLGSAYEPYIFAALNSAKVMVVLGTKPDYFNAVWVKNEWSRYLALIKNGADKVLIPAYKDMDPYDLPEEFSHLQAQDMSKLGFMQDLIRGIEKLAKASKPKYVNEQTAQGNSNIAPLLRRAFLFLEDGDWESADEYCEKVLDLDPENGEAYLGKMMIELKVCHRESLADMAEPFDNNAFYKKAIRFGDEKLVEELKGYIKAIKQKSEHARLSSIYKKAQTVLSLAKNEEDYKNASDLFASISGFDDADEKAHECAAKANEVHFGGLYANALALMKTAKTEEDFIKASKAFAEIKDYKDAEKLSADCLKKAEETKNDAIYATAVALMAGNKVKNYKKAITELEKIKGWKDSNQKIEYCNNKIQEIAAGMSALATEKMQRDEARKEAFQEKLPLIKKVAFVVVPVLVIALIAAVVLPKINWDNTNTIDIENTPTATITVTPTPNATETIVVVTPTPTPIIAATPTVAPTATPKTNGTIMFGTYEQDNNISNGKEPIEWLVLEKKNGRALVISKYGLDSKQYHTRSEDVTWETCSLREWLNNDFFNIAFSVDEKAKIPTVTVSADKNPSFPDVDPGNATNDKVFLLSLLEVNKYFSSDSARQCKLTAYAIANGAKKNGFGNCSWRLRTPGRSLFVTACVDWTVFDSGPGVSWDGETVRPAMWIDLS